jgi:hypothetical protein
VVLLHDFEGPAGSFDSPLPEKDGAVAEARNAPEVVRDEHDRLSVAPHLLEGAIALLLERLVADSEDLVEEEDFERDLNGD